VSAEAEVSVFLNSMLHYFETTVQQVAASGTPHLALRRRPELSDYTGIIRISGRRDGVVLFTAPKSMLCVMLMCMQDTNLSHDHLCELVGEIANTLSGQARRNFRHQFSVTVQSVVHERDAPMVYPPNSRPIVIPIAWRSYQARLVVCLDRDTARRVRATAHYDAGSRDRRNGCAPGQDLNSEGASAVNVRGSRIELATTIAPDRPIAAAANAGRRSPHAPIALPTDL
jgi:chemotaxis protein CheX